jgi:exonuclease III
MLFFWKKNNSWLNRTSVLLLIISTLIFAPNLKNKIPNQSKNNEKPIRLLSFNINDFRSILKDGTFKNGIKEISLANFSKEIGQVDILCGQEVSYAKNIMETLRLPNAFGLRGRGNSLYTRFPIIEKGEVNFSKKTGNGALWADLQLPDSTLLRVYSVHLQSYQITPILTDLKKGNLWKIPTLIRKIGHSVCKRQAQAEKLLAHAKDSPHPTIIAGDFNSLPQSALIDLFQNDFEDFFKEMENGWGQTYRSGLPYFRLDYIFYNKQIQPLKYKKIKMDISDHYPILGEFIIEN